MVDLRSSALSALRDGRVTLQRVKDPRVIAHVRSSRPERETPYVVDRWADGDGSVSWLCSCGKAPGCAHVAATALVTYPDESGAAKHLRSAS